MISMNFMVITLEDEGAAPDGAESETLTDGLRRYDHAVAEMAARRLRRVILVDTRSGDIVADSAAP